MTQSSNIWHPITQHALSNPEIHIDRADGASLYQKDGREIIDAISSWWVITHGHCHPKIVKAVQDQAAKLDQIIFAGFTHSPAQELTDALLKFTDHKFDYVFYSDSGSTAVEAALKMAIGYFEHTGKPRRKILALDGGYHGDTFGAMAASGRSVFTKIYEPYLFEVHHLPNPAYGNHEQTLKSLRDILSQDGDDVAALILEPLVLGADGMKMYAPETLKAMYDLCAQHGTLFIADEVMTGFGRTGTKFACEQAGFAPDIMCLSKGLTGGFMAMGATLCHKKIYNAFYQKDRAKTFFHSSSFTGNPLACAAALANLKIWEEEDVLERLEAINHAHHAAKDSFESRDDIADVRIQGTIMAIDITVPDGGYLSNVGPVLYDFYLSEGVLLRPLGNTVYILPPYCITNEDLEKIYDTIRRSLDLIRDDREQREVRSAR